MGATSRVYICGNTLYADDITLLCPSVCGLNEMLKICKNIDGENNIILTVRKQCVLNLKVALFRGISIFDGVMLEWTDKVRHRGNFIDTTCSNYIDCIAKNLKHYSILDLTILIYMDSPLIV